MKNKMTLSIWTKCSNTLKLPLSVISSSKKTIDLNNNGLMSKRDLIWWWKLKDLKMSKLSKNARRRRDLLDSKDLELSLIRSRSVISNALKRKNCVRRSVFNCSKILRTKSNMNLNKQQLARRESRFWWLRLLKQTKLLLNLKRKESRRKRILKKVLLITRRVLLPKKRKQSEKRNVSPKKRKEKSKDFASSKRKPKIVKLKSMPWKLREHLKKAKK